MSQSYERLFEIKKESLKLLETQGYNIDEERFLFDASLKDFEIYYTKTLFSENSPVAQFLKEEGLITNTRSCLSNIYSSYLYENTKVVVYFAFSYEKKVTDLDISAFCRMIERFGVNNAILISEVPLSATAESLCTEFVPCRVKNGKRYGCFIQHFEDNELFFDPTDHVFAPVYRLLRETEAEEFMKSEKIKKRQLPQMSALDPIAKRLGARPDDIVEFTRKILIPGTLIQSEIFYREIYMPQKEKKDRAVKK
jgi:DNA-directed RNA polymerase subunit H (RpoH/RPB5)